MFQNHIEEIVDKLSILVDLPIMAIGGNGEIISCRLFNNTYYSLVEDNKILEVSVNSLTDKSLYFYPLGNRLFFFSTPINNDIKNGVYLIGPCSCSKEHNIGYKYKPRYVVPYILKILRSIEKDYSLSKVVKDSIYNFHISKANHYISANYNTKISLDSISKYLNLDKTYFCKIYKKETKKSFSLTLNEIRIEKSKSLLMEENHSILDVALAVGFNDQTYFSNVFKKITGFTPTEYRNGAVGINN